MKKSTFLTIIAMIAYAILLAACQKTTTAPSAPPTTTASTLDTSLIGNYKMVFSSVTTELDTNVRFHTSYSSHYTDAAGTYIWYALTGYSSLPTGLRKVSKNVTYDDSNNSDAKIQQCGNNISAGFGSDAKCKLNGANRISGDTIILNFHISPTAGPQFDMQNKYRRF